MVTRARWYVDSDGTYWRHSKAHGGIQSLDEGGKYGVPMRLSDAIDEYELTPVATEVGLVLDAFDGFTIEAREVKQFTHLRDSVVLIVAQMSEYTAETAAAASKAISGRTVVDSAGDDVS